MAKIFSRSNAYIWIMMICLFVIFWNIMNWGKYRENFYTYYENNVSPYDPMTINFEYKKLPMQPPLGPLNMKKLNALKWETRFPGLVKQRYSYNDKRYYGYQPAIPGVARLNELRNANINKYNAVVPEIMVGTSLTYWPDVNPQISFPKMRPQPKATYKKPLPGFNPNSILPAQYADRSKVSVENCLVLDPYWI